MLALLLVLAVPATAVVPLADLPTALPGPGLVAPAADDAAARAVVRALPRATAAMDRDGDKLWDDLEQRYLAAVGQDLDVVVTFRAGTSPEAGLAKARAAAGPFAADHTFHIIPAFSAQLSLAQALKVARLPEVRQVEFNAPGFPELDTATAFFGADHVADDLGVTGDRDGLERRYSREDVVIAILDTGFDGQHMDLDEGKIIHFRDPDGEAEAYDAGMHGTHVASIAAGSGDADQAFRGVAPGAAIVGLKIVSAKDGCAVVLFFFGLECTFTTMDHAMAGFEWIVDHREEFGIDIATMSFGFGGNTDGTSAMELAVDATWDAGVVVFKSLGNSGPERGTVTIPGAARGILSIGSMLDPGGEDQFLLGLGEPPVQHGYGFHLSEFSSRGPTEDGRIKPEFVVSGQSVTAARAGSGDGYVALSGTSMASPLAAGIAALVLDANPALTPDEVRAVFQRTAEDWGAPGPDVDYGWGRLRAAEAVVAAFAEAGVAPPRPASSPVVPYHESRSGALDATGLAEAAFEVAVPGVPLAVTAIVEGELKHVQVVDPDGRVVLSQQSATLLPMRRQHQVGFVPESAGTYLVRLLGDPGIAWVLDASHGRVDPTPLAGSQAPTGPRVVASASPDRVAVDAGGAASFQVQLANRGGAAAAVRMAAVAHDQVRATWNPEQLTLAPGEEAFVGLTVTPQVHARAGAYTLLARALYADGPELRSATASLTLEVTPAPPGEPLAPASVRSDERPLGEGPVRGAPVPAWAALAALAVGAALVAGPRRR